MDYQDELATLRAQRVKAIKNCEFRKAREIDAQLQHLKESIIDDKTEDLQRECQEKYEDEKEAIRLDAEKNYSDATEAIFQAKSLYQQKMSDLQKKHAEELALLAESFAKNLELATIREVPDSIIFREQAKASAMVQQYEKAETLLDMSNSVRETTLQERQNEIRQQYETFKTQLIEKHTAEDRTCEMVYLKNVESIKRKHHLAGERLKKRLDFRAYSLKVPVTSPADVEINELEMADEEEVAVKPKRSVSAPTSALANRGGGGSASPIERRGGKQTSPKIPGSAKKPNVPFSGNNTNRS